MDKIKLHRLTAVVIVYAICGSLALMFINAGYAQSTKQNKGLKFQVPDDWPIEERGGLVGPIPTDEYVSMKFEKADKEFSAFREEFTKKIDELKKSIESIDSSASVESVNIESVEKIPESAGSDLTEVLSRLDELEKQLSLLDKKMANRSALLKSQIKSVIQDIETLKQK